MKVMKSSLFLGLLFVLCAFGAIAQPDNPNPTPTPFGFVELLIGAGAFYGGRKAYQKKRSVK
jgi:hypothetical protein